MNLFCGAASSDCKSGGVDIADFAQVDCKSLGSQRGISLPLKQRRRCWSVWKPRLETSEHAATHVYWSIVMCVSRVHNTHGVYWTAVPAQCIHETAAVDVLINNCGWYQKYSFLISLLLQTLELRCMCSSPLDVSGAYPVGRSVRTSG